MKFDVSSLIPINWFISCNNSLFAGTTLTLRKSQVHCSGVMQRWACSSLMHAALPAGICVAKRPKGDLTPRFLDHIVICALRGSITNKIVLFA